MPCSRTQYGLTRVGLEPPTSGSGVRGTNHQATTLPCGVRGLVKEPLDCMSYDWPESPMLHTKFCRNRPTGCSEEIFEGLLPYMGVTAILVM